MPYFKNGISPRGLYIIVMALRPTNLKMVWIFFTFKFILECEKSPSQEIMCWTTLFSFLVHVHPFNDYFSHKHSNNGFILLTNFYALLNESSLVTTCTLPCTLKAILHKATLKLCRVHPSPKAQTVAPPRPGPTHDDLSPQTLRRLPVLVTVYSTLRR